MKILSVPTLLPLLLVTLVIIAYAGAKASQLTGEGVNLASADGVRILITKELPRDVKAAFDLAFGEVAPAEAAAADDPPRSVTLCDGIDDTLSNDRPNQDGGPSDPAPDRLRPEMASLLIGSTGADVGAAEDSIGFVVFRGGLPEHLAQVPVTRISDDEARRFLSNALASVGFGKGQGWTRWDVALNACLAMLEEADPANRAPPYHAPGSIVAAILTTDGRPEDSDPAYAGEAQMEVLRDQVLPVFVSRGWPIYTVGYAAGAEEGTPYRGYLEEIAAVTGGKFYAAAERDDLLPIAVSIIADATGRALYQGTPTQVIDEREFDVSVGRDVETLTINVIRSTAALDVTVFRPDGSRVRPTADSGVKLTASNLFENWTFNNPEAGLWKVVLRGEGQVYVNRLVRHREGPPPATPTPVPTPSSPSPTPGSDVAAGGSQPDSGLNATGGIVLAGLSGGLAFVIAAGVAGWYVLTALGRGGALQCTTTGAEIDLEDELGASRWLPWTPELSVNGVLAALNISAVGLEAKLQVHHGSLTLAVDQESSSRIMIFGGSVTPGLHHVPPDSEFTVDGVTIRYLRGEEHLSEPEFA